MLVAYTANEIRDAALTAALAAPAFAAVALDAILRRPRGAWRAAPAGRDAEGPSGEAPQAPTRPGAPVGSRRP